jgi:hypothetical protein
MECSVSASAGRTAGTDILKQQVGFSAVVSEFQELSENEAFVAMVSFSEIINHEGPNQASKDSE